MHVKINETNILDFYSKQSTEHPSSKMTLRVGHIKDVVRYSNMITKSIGLDAHGESIAKIVAWLHDYYQVLQIGGGSPNPHLHHSDPEALQRTLFGNGMIDVYAEGLSAFDKDVIKTAISQHAKIAVELPEDTTPHHVLFCNIIRDADKAAIYELVTNPIHVLKDDWGFTDEQIAESRSKDGNKVGVSDNVRADFMRRKCINNGDIKTPADWVLNQLGYLYNVQMKVTLESMLHNAATLVSNLPFNDEINDIVRGCYYHALNVLVIGR